MFVIAAQVFSVLMAIIAISKSYVDFRGKVESFGVFLFWFLTWLSIVIVALFPSIIARLIAAGGGQAGLGTFFGMVIVFLFFLVYRVYVRLKRVEQNLTATVREMALREDWMPKQK